LRRTGDAKHTLGNLGGKQLRPFGARVGRGAKGEAHTEVEPGKAMGVGTGGRLGGKPREKIGKKRTP